MRRVNPFEQLADLRTPFLKRGFEVCDLRSAKRSVGIRDHDREFLAHPSRVCVPPPYGGANYATSGDMGQETREGYLKRKLLN